MMKSVREWRIGANQAQSCRSVCRCHRSVGNLTKLVIVVDPDISVRNWEEVMWAVATRFDASRDLVVMENTPIDYLDFASPKAGLGTKMGIDATNKFEAETDREWGRVLEMPAELAGRAAEMWERIRNGAGL